MGSNVIGAAQYSIVKQQELVQKVGLATTSLRRHRSSYPTRPKIR
jgi:hypothetical protein